MKISRFIAVAAAAVLSASIFCACGGGGGKSSKAEQTTEAKAENKSPKLKPAGGKSSGNKSSGNKSSGTKAKEENKSFQLEAKYTLHCAEEVESETVILAKDLGASSWVKLEKGGTGTMEMDGEKENIEWVIEDDIIYIYTKGDDPILYGYYEEGFLYLVVYGQENVFMIYVQDGADTSPWDAAATKQ